MPRTFTATTDAINEPIRIYRRKAGPDGERELLSIVRVIRVGRKPRVSFTDVGEDSPFYVESDSQARRREAREGTYE